MFYCWSNGLFTKCFFLSRSNQNSGNWFCRSFSRSRTCSCCKKDEWKPSFIKSPMKESKHKVNFSTHHRNTFKNKNVHTIGNICIKRRKKKQKICAESRHLRILYVLCNLLHKEKKNRHAIDNQWLSIVKKKIDVVYIIWDDNYIIFTTHLHTTI